MITLNKQNYKTPIHVKDCCNFTDFSPSSRDIFSKITLPTSLPQRSLKDRALSYLETNDLLEKTKQNQGFEKVGAWAQVALQAALLVGTILLCKYSFILGLTTLALITTITSVSIGLCSIHKMETLGKKTPFCEPLPSSFTLFAFLGGGFILPLIEMSRKENALKRLKERELKDLKTTVETYRTFLSSNYSSLKKTLSEQISSQRSTFQQNNLRLALKELDAAFQFFYPNQQATDTREK